MKTPAITRGSWCLTACRPVGAVFKADRQRKCEVAAGPGVLLVKPSTFMNESGLCVGPMMRFFKLDPRSVFVIHDEVDFPWA